MDDVVDAWHDLKTNDCQFSRRSYVRTTFAFIEGFTAVLKSGALAEFQAGRATLALAEVALLLEESYSAADDGKALVRGSYLPLAANVRFAFDMFARTHGATETPDFSSDGWRALKDSVRIRNRVTHPKVTGDLHISDDEVKTIDRGWEWYLDASLLLFTDGKAQLIAKLKPLGLEPHM